MKEYYKYMDHIKVSDTLHRRLLELEPPGKRPAAWKKYGGAAEALALVCAVGGFSAWAAHINSLNRPTPPYPSGYQEVEPENADLGRPDIAVEDPGTTLEPGMKTAGGYEVQQGGMTAYFMLPYIEFGMADNVGQMSLDWDVPPGCVRRDLTPADIAALFGGEEALSTHLNWGGYTLTGWAAWNGDGSLWGMFINGHKGPLDYFELAFTAGDAYPPTCIAYGEGKVNELWDVPVTAYGHDGGDGVSRRVEFLHGGYGFRFDLTGTDPDQTQDLVSRATRWLIVEGVAVENVAADGAVLAHPWEADPNDSVGEPNYEDGEPEQDGAETSAYDPGEAADPSDYAPAKGPDDSGAGSLPDGADYSHRTSKESKGSF